MNFKIIYFDDIFEDDEDNNFDVIDLNYVTMDF